MANTSRPCGFQPHGKLIHVGVYQAGGTIYPGDLVKFKSDGTVEVAAAADAILGAALIYAVSGGEILVADDPAQLFEAEADTTEVDAQTDINLNYDFVAASADTTYRLSRHVIDASTQATTATLPLKVLKIVPKADNALGADVKLVCKINNHQLGSHTGTAGV